MPYDLYGEDAQAGGWLAAARARMREEGEQRAPRPNWGDTRWAGPGGYIPLPAYDSNVGEFLARAITMGPMALRSSAGAQVGRDNVWAGRMERSFPNERAITGGDPDPFPTPSRNFDPRVGPRYEPYANSSTGLARNPAIQPAADAAPYHPARQDYPRAGNVNELPPMTREQIQARIRELENYRLDKVWRGEWSNRSQGFHNVGDEIGRLMGHTPSSAPALRSIPGGRID